MHSDGTSPSKTPEQQLSALLADLVERTPGTLHALLVSGDGLKTAYTDMPVDDADRLAASTSALNTLARGQFAHSTGRTRQVVVEHDAGYLFVMSAGEHFTDECAAMSTLTVTAGPDANPGQVGHEMQQFVRGLDEHLVVGARTNSYSRPGL